MFLNTGTAETETHTFQKNSINKFESVLHF